MLFIIFLTNLFNNLLKPVAPLGFKAPPYFEKAIPAISKCAQGVLFKINLCKNWAAVVNQRHQHN